MLLELDHVFVFADPDDRSRLTKCGLTPGSGRRHAGQGTANARYFFRNAYLELIWVENETEAKSSVTAPTSLWERSRWRQTGASPFGIALRNNEPTAALPFKTWNYRPSYLPADAEILLATPSGAIHEPLVFVVPGAPPPSEYPPDRAEPLEHPAGVRSLSRVIIDVCGDEPFTVGLKEASSIGMVEIGRVRVPMMRIEFDNGASDLTADFRDAIPMSFG